MPAPKVQPPKLYLRKDATGKWWSDPNPVWLAEHVRRVNASLPRYYYAPLIQYGYGSACAGGACGR
jgi:hypothetical protein